MKAAICFGLPAGQALGCHGLSFGGVSNLAVCCPRLPERNRAGKLGVADESSTCTTAKTRQPKPNVKHWLLIFVAVFLADLIAAQAAELIVAPDPQGRTTTRTHAAAWDLLLPAPHEVKAEAGRVRFGASIRLSVPDEWAGAVGQYLWLLNEVLEAREAEPVILVKRKSAAAIRVVRKPDGGLPENGYELKIGRRVIELTAASPSGVFNGLATLAQLIELGESETLELPRGQIRDWPELATRAVHIDMTTQQYKAAYVQRLMRTLARYKVNAILMEYSDMFPFRRHQGICRPDALSESDIVAIRRTAEECNQEIIPFLQCLGHLEYILHKPGCERYGKDHDQYMLCPSAEETMPFVRELIDEILEQHPRVKRLHVGGDEADPAQHGQCPRCPEYTKQHGFSSLYVRHYSQVAQYCASRQVTPLIWSDMILKHPAAITELPRNMAWIVWDYSTRSDPTPSLVHGAAMRAFNKLSPEYRHYFGAGVGLADAEKRGGLVAFGHALGFKTLGFQAFNAPAARCAGDNFDLPRFEWHMQNIQVASRKAAEFGLPGVIVTSWSYRGSSHEVCLPEYACIASAWNRATLGPAVLMRQFFAQRFGITDANLGAAILDLSPVVPPSCLAQPALDDARGAWVMGGDHQLRQISEALKRDPKGKLRQWQSWQQQVEMVSKRLRESATQARHADELRKWELALAHLSHRLKWLQTLASRIVPDRNPQSDQADFSAFEAACDELRAKWADAYKDIHTPLSLTAQLYTRFDTEKEIAKAVLSNVATKPGD